MKQPVFKQGKDSTDSGAAELNMSVEAASTQSCSSRGFSVPPPMRNIGTRDGKFIVLLYVNINTKCLKENRNNQ